MFMANSISARLRNGAILNGMDIDNVDLAEAADHIDTQDSKIKALVEALEELVTCVDDGCYCSEMKMASAIDTANETIASAKEN